MTEAVIFGAGNVGRGFLGQLLSESGYDLVFVDVDRSLVGALNQGSYTIRMVDGDFSEDVEVGPVRALDAQGRDEVALAVSRAPFLATAVGARALPAVAESIALGLRKRSTTTDDPTNIVVCENLKGAAQHLRSLVIDRLGADRSTWLDTHVGFVDTVIARMVPTVPDEIRARDPAFILVEPYRVLPVAATGFVGPIPRLAGVEPRDNFGAYVDRKLYMHNAGHAVLAYLGYQGHHTYGYEALADPAVARVVLAALEESKSALGKRHGLDPVALAEHIGDLTHRFRNRALGDTILRLGRDVVRKLGHDDRLVGAAVLCHEMGGEPRALTWGIAAALAFDDPRDPWAAELAAKLARDGVLSVLWDVCGLETTHPVASMTAARWESIRSGRLWPALEDEFHDLSRRTVLQKRQAERGS